MPSQDPGSSHTYQNALSSHPTKTGFTQLMYGAKIEHIALVMIQGCFWNTLLLLFSHTVVSDCLQYHGLQHTLQDPSLSFTISWSLLKLMSIESVMPYNHLILSCPLLLLPSLFPSSRSFSKESTLSTSGGQITRALASASVLLMNTQYWFPLGLTGLISLKSRGLLRVFSNS